MFTKLNIHSVYNIHAKVTEIFTDTLATQVQLEMLPKAEQQQSKLIWNSWELSVTTTWVDK